MSAPIERKTVPNPFRDQYSGGVEPDAEFEAALNGQLAPSKPNPRSAVPQESEGFLYSGPVKLR